MCEDTQATTTMPGPSGDVLTKVLRDGAQRLLEQALEAVV